MTVLQHLDYQLVTTSLRLIAEVLGLGRIALHEMWVYSPVGAVDTEMFPHHSPSPGLLLQVFRHHGPWQATA
jgi:hypothetical protein